MSVLLLGGSPSQTSSSSRLLQHIGARLALRGHRSTQLQVRDLPAQALLHADFNDEAIARATRLLLDADAIVIGTPVYKASYSGILKAFLDLLPQDGLAGKLVLPLATGGSQSHMLALDYALRPVLASLSARLILPSVYATPEQLIWQQDGSLMADSPIGERLARAVELLSPELYLAASHRVAGPAAGLVEA